MKLTSFPNSYRSFSFNQNHVAMMSTQPNLIQEIGVFQKSLFHRVEKISQSLSVTPSVFMMTAFHILAFHWQKQNGENINSPVLKDMKARKLLRKIQVTVEEVQEEGKEEFFYLHLLELNFSFPLSAIIDVEKSTQKVWMLWQYREGKMDQQTVLHFMEWFPKVLEQLIENLATEVSLFKTFLPEPVKDRKKDIYAILPKIEVLEYDWKKAKKEDTFIFPEIEEPQGLIESLRKKKENR